MFVTTGGLAAVVIIGLRIWLSASCAMSGPVALAYVMGMILAFLLAYRFVFQANGLPFGRSFGRFATVNLLSCIWMASSPQDREEMQ